MITSSSSCALKGSLRPQSAPNATMYSNWLVRSPIFLPQNSIPDPWWSGAVHERGLMKRGMPTTARSGGSSGGSTPDTTVAIFPRFSPAYVVPLGHRAPSLTPSWSTVLIVRVHVMLSFCGWRPRLACGAWRSLRSRPVMYTRMLTAGTSSCEGKGDGRELYRSRTPPRGLEPRYPGLRRAWPAHCARTPGPCIAPDDRPLHRAIPPSSQRSSRSNPHPLASITR